MKDNKAALAKAIDDVTFNASQVAKGKSTAEKEAASKAMQQARKDQTKYEGLEGSLI